VRGAFRQSATSLGVVRAIVHTIFLVQVITTDFAALGRLPTTIMHPPGVLDYLSWKFFDRLIQPQTMLLFQGVLIVALLAGCVGFLTRFSTVASLLLVGLHQGVLRSFGHFNHDEMAPLLCLAILAASPCGEGFAVDARRKPRQRTRSFVYGYPIALMQMVIAWSYCTSGLLKLRLGGWEYFGPESLIAICTAHSLDNLHDTQFRLAFHLQRIQSFVPLLLAGAVAWEVLFPLGMVFRRLLPWFLAIGVLFHVSTMLMLNITFPTHLATYLVFAPWDRIRLSARRSGWLKRPRRTETVV
jgi:Vitamin K-dependent gamma-carboxylase